MVKITACYNNNGLLLCATINLHLILFMQQSCSEFTCDNGVCMSNVRRCDFVNDCGDGSDEFGCGKSLSDIMITRSLARVPRPLPISTSCVWKGEN